MSGPVIRTAVAADRPRIDFIRAAVRENRLGDPARVSDAEVRWYLEEGVFLVSEGQGAVWGFGCANPRTGLVWALFVDPDAEEQGHGGALLDALCAALRRAGLIQAHLTTEPGTRAAEFYRRRQWRCTGRVWGGELAFVKDLR